MKIETVDDMTGYIEDARETCRAMLFRLRAAQVDDSLRDMAYDLAEMLDEIYDADRGFYCDPE